MNVLHATLTRDAEGGMDMINRRAALCGIAILVAMSTSACGSSGTRFPDYRYRLTVEVDTPEGVRSGSSVIEVQTYDTGPHSIPSPNSLVTRMTGEAVAVDLPDGKTLFALLRSDRNVDWAKGVMSSIIADREVPSGEGDPFPRRFAVMLERKGLYQLPRQFPDPPPYIDKSDAPTAYPMLVTFKDIADPKTVEKVDPDDLVATFGKGYALKRITIQLTDDLVTTGIEKRLVWLPSIYEMDLGPEFKPPGIPLGDFQGLFEKDNG